MKRKLPLLMLYIALLPVFIFAQPVIKTQLQPAGTNADFFVKIILPKEGGFIAAGSSNSFVGGDKTESKGDYDFWLVKYNSAGIIEWDKTVGSGESDNLGDIQQTNDSGYILVGMSKANISGDKTESNRGYPYSDYWIVKLDKNRNIEWNKTYGGSVNDLPVCVRQTADDGYIVGGWSLSGISGDKTEANKGDLDIWILKLDANGNMQWQKTIGGSGNDGGYAYGDDNSPTIILPLSDGGYLIGSTSASGISGDKTDTSRGFSDYWLIKLNSEGNILWDKTIGGNSYEQLRTLNATKDGGFIIGGTSFSGISGEKTDTARGGNDFWLVKLDSNANIMWDKTIGGNESDRLTSIDKTSDGYILGGHSNSARLTGEKTEGRRGIVGYFDYWVVKTDTLGNVQWDKTIGGIRDERLYSVKEIKKDKYLIGGWSSSDSSKDKKTPRLGDFDYWMVGLVFKNNQAIITNNLSEITQNKNVKNTFILYPNPVKDILHVQHAGKATFTLTFTLINQSGKIVLSKTIIDNDVLNVSSLPAGVYYLKKNESGEVRKIFISK